ncbi:MAG: tyrosine--tRNA ligase [Candidatus Levybacteria bacterium]|nr:tyrosine--tRNA ligase [Candidatus Levybacteria bacterium]
MDQIEELLTRGVDTIYPTKEELEKVLRSGKKLTLYQGFDPTGDKLHVGHMVGLMKMADWQRLGHHVIFLIGDGTGQAGDPSGKTKSRDTFFTKEQLRENAKDYVMQASKIVDFEGDNPIEIKYNSDWLNILDLPKMLEIFDHASLQQLIERDLFQERLKNKERVSMREFLYPLLQGYDSVAMGVDLEIGGTDQTFNMLVGRQFVKDYLNKEKYVMTTPLLTDATGNKIGKTEGNAIAITDNPAELYAKIMTFPDEVVVKSFEYLTRIPMNKVKEIEKAISGGENPMVYKKKLAYAIAAMLNSDEDAASAQEAFEKNVQRGELPEEITEVSLSDTDEEFVNEDLLVDLNLASSKSDAKRLFQQGGVEVNGKRIVDSNKNIQITNGMIIKVGKRKIVKLKSG